MKRKNNNQSRAAGKTQISIALPQELVDRIDAQAALENRNRSNFIVTSMEQVMDKMAPTAPKPAKANADKSHKAAVAKTVVKKTAAASSKGKRVAAATGKKVEAKRQWYRRSPEEIKAILAELKKGSTVAQMCQKHGVGQSTLWRWKSLNQ